MDQAGLIGRRPARAGRSFSAQQRSLELHSVRPSRAWRRDAPHRRGPAGPARILAWLGAACVLAIAAGGLLLDRAYHDRVLPGVHLAALPLGGLDEAATSGLVESHLSQFLASPMHFTFEDRVWRPKAAEIGLQLNAAAMAQQALLTGRNTLLPFRPISVLLAPVRRPPITLATKLDTAQLGAFLSAVAAEVDRPAVNASVQVRNGQISVARSFTGREVDIPATIKRVTRPERFDQPQRVEVAVNLATPALTEDVLRDAETTATRILAAPLTLHTGQRTWTLTPAALGAMIDVKRGASDQHVAALNEAKVAAYVRTLAAEIDRPAANAQLRWTGSAVAVIRESHDGVKLDQAGTVRAIIAQAGTERRDIALTTTTTRPAVSSETVEQLGISAVLASGNSRFTGSPPERVNNIEVAAARLNGVVVPAGSTFSFLKSLGEITKENGYQEGLTIQGDATVPGVGGGVCQVSTTIFRAAFFAGLPIVERHQHTYRVGYYEQDGSPVGFDAAVYDPGVDFRFKNDTPGAILIEAAVDRAAATITFRLIGTSSGRQVQINPSRANEVKAGPAWPDVPDPTLPKGTRKQVEWKADGVDATVRRVVTQNGRPLLTDSFFSRYVPWREKWAVGAG